MRQNYHRAKIGPVSFDEIKIANNNKSFSPIQHSLHKSSENIAAVS